MEERKQLVSLSPVRKNSTNTNSNSASSKSIENEVIGINGVSILLAKDIEENYSNIKTMQDLIDLDNRKPYAVKKISPPIYKDYFDEKKGKLIPYVKVGDTVEIRHQYIEKNHSNIGKVFSVDLASLSDMTVIIAKLEDGRMFLAKALIFLKDAT